jgi:hypothetical protein
MICHRTYSVTVLTTFALVFEQRDSRVGHTTVAGIMDTVSQAPTVIRDISQFYIWPHRFGQDWRLLIVPHASAADTITWVLAFTTLAVGLYRIAIRSSPLRRIKSNEPERTRAEVRQAGMKDPPDRPKILRFFIVERSVHRSVESGEIIGHGASIGIGIEFAFPEQSSKSSDEPQLILVKMGLVYVLMRATPAKFKTRFFQAGFVLWLALSSALFLYPFATLLGGPESFSQSLRIAIVIWSYLFLLSAIVGVIQWFIKKRIDNALRGFIPTVILLSSGIFIWQLIASIEAFAGFYGLSLGRMVLAAFIGIITAGVASLATTPLVFAPLLYLSLRFSDLWNLLFG